MCRASALAYSRLNVCSVHSCGNSIRYGRAITAYHDGLRDHLHGERLVPQRVRLAGLRAAW